MCAPPPGLDVSDNGLPSIFDVDMLGTALDAVGVTGVAILTNADGGGFLASEHFMPALLPEHEFMKRSTKEPLSDICDLSLEAFGVLVIENNYKKWSTSFTLEQKKRERCQENCHCYKEEGGGNTQC